MKISKRVLSFIMVFVLLFSATVFSGFTAEPENAGGTKKVTPKSYQLTATTAVYNGKAQKPQVKVYEKNGKKIAAKHYNVTYKNNVKPGKATANVHMKNNYEGSKTLGFKILPKKASKPTLSTKKQKQLTVKLKEDTTVSGHQIRYSTSKKFKNAKTLHHTNSAGLHKTISKLKNDTTYYVAVRGYKYIDGKKHYGAWSGTQKVRVSSAAAHPNLPDEMLDSYVMDAMKYVGYKADKQAKAGTLLQDCGSGPRTPMRFRSGIRYGGGPLGTETVKDKKSPTGKKPDISRFKQNGMVCSSFVTYYYLNYLPNVAGVNTNDIRSAMKKSGVKFNNCNSWGYAAEYLVKRGKATLVDSVKKGRSLPAAHLSRLKIGDLITFRIPNEGLEWGHVAVYAGTNNEGDHFVAHVGSDEGPVFQTLERFENVVNDHDGCAYKNVYRFKNLPSSKYQYTVKTKSVSYKYTGKAVKPTVLAKDAIGKTISPKNYTLYYSNNVKRGTATVKAVFKGKYVGVKSATFKIK